MKQHKPKKKKARKRAGHTLQKIKSYEDPFDKLRAAQMGNAYHKECVWVIHNVLHDDKYPSTKCVYDKTQPIMPHQSVGYIEALRPLGDAIKAGDWGFFLRMAETLQFIKEEGKKIKDPMRYNALSYLMTETVKWMYRTRAGKVTKKELRMHLQFKGHSLDESNFATRMEPLGLDLEEAEDGPDQARRQRQ